MKDKAVQAVLSDLEKWFQHSLSGEIKGRQTGTGPTFNAYSYVEIPEWSMRQKLDAIQKTRAALLLVEGEGK